MLCFRSNIIKTYSFKIKWYFERVNFIIFALNLRNTQEFIFFVNLESNILHHIIVLYLLAFKNMMVDSSKDSKVFKVIIKDFYGLYWNN